MHLTVSGIWYLAAHLAVASDRSAADVAPGERIPYLDAARDLLLLHGLFHFASDVACARWETLLHRPCWNDHWNCLSAPYVELEEALANASMLRHVERHLRRAAERFCAIQPSGYRDGPQLVETRRFEDVLLERTRGGPGLHAVKGEGDIRIVSPVSESPFPVLDVWPDADLGLVRSGDASVGCPVHVHHDDQNLGWPGGSTALIPRFQSLRTMSSFEKDLQRCPKRIQDEWERCTLDLRQGNVRPWRLRKWRDGLWCLDFSLGYRAHIRRVAGYKDWEALEIKDHKGAGHG